MMRVLIVCNSCINRAPTIRDLVHNDYKSQLLCYAAGTHAYREYDQLKPNTCEWAEHIFCATTTEAMWLIDKMGPEIRKKIAILGIEDKYDYMDQALVDIYDIFYKYMFAELCKVSAIKESQQWGKQ